MTNWSSDDGADIIFSGENRITLIGLGVMVPRISNGRYMRYGLGNQLQPVVLKKLYCWKAL